MPDIFVPQDTTGITSYFTMAVNRGLTIQFSFQYTDKNRQKLAKYKTGDELLKYLKTQNILEKFAQYAESKGLKRRNLLMYTSKELFYRNLYGNIIYNMLNMEEYLKYLKQSDKTVLKALEILEKEESFPKAPEQQPASAHERTEETIA
jgi:carboxyl-terminal processing protease